MHQSIKSFTNSVCKFKNYKFLSSWRMQPQNTNDTSREQSVPSSFDAEQRAQQLETLVSRITHSNAQLFELASDDQKLTRRVRDYNEAAINFVNNSVQYDMALIYLQEAEKVLEYAASCGKTIDRLLIVHNLHNEASVYQKLWELEKSSDYMEAILFNMGVHIYEPTPIAMSSYICDKNSQEYLTLSSYTHRRLSTIRYLLQYSAVSSQNGKHQRAIESIKKSLKLLKLNLSQSVQYAKLAYRDGNRVEELEQLRGLCEGIDEQGITHMLFQIHDKYSRLRQQEVGQSSSSELHRKLSTFSIGQVMQIQPISFEALTETVNMDALLSKIGIIRIALYISICYYAFATEIRLSNSASLGLCGEKATNIEKSKIYHSFAIKIMLDFVPYSSDYLLHIIKSFKNNYSVDIMWDVPQVDSTQLQLHKGALKGEQFGLISKPDQPSSDGLPVNSFQKINLSTKPTHILNSRAVEHKDEKRTELRLSPGGWGNEDTQLKSLYHVKTSKSPSNRLAAANEQLQTSKSELQSKSGHHHHKSSIYHCKGRKVQPKYNSRKSSCSSGFHSLKGNGKNRLSSERGSKDTSSRQQSKRRKNSVRVIDEYLSTKVAPKYLIPIIKKQKARSNSKIHESPGQEKVRSKSKGNYKLKLTKSNQVRPKSSMLVLPQSGNRKAEDLKSNS